MKKNGGGKSHATVPLRVIGYKEITQLSFFAGALRTNDEGRAPRPMRNMCARGYRNGLIFALPTYMF